MNIRALIYTLLFLPCCIAAQENSNRAKFNAGIKAGFQAITYNDPEFSIDGYEFNTSTIQSNKIGYTVAPFIRVTYSRFYIQTEAAFGIARHSFDFTDKREAAIENISPNTPVYELKAYCLQVPILIGYEFVEEDRFGMSVFTGPRTKFTFTAHSEQEFRHFSYDDLEEVLNKKVYYWEAGLGVRIYNVFFDFAYDLGLTKASRYIQASKVNKRFKAERRDNILSFSVGMIF